MALQQKVLRDPRLKLFVYFVVPLCLDHGPLHKYECIAVYALSERSVRLSFERDLVACYLAPSSQILNEVVFSFHGHCNE